MIDRQHISSLEEMRRFAGQLATQMNGGVWCLDGPMGAGKTTLVTMLCKEWGVTDPVSSPTYGLLNVYTRPLGTPVHHFDFYRLTRPEEALDIGAEEYFESGDLCLVEWPSRVAELLPEACSWVFIRTVDSGRWVTVETP